MKLALQLPVQPARVGSERLVGRFFSEFALQHNADRSVTGRDVLTSIGEG